MPEVMAEGSNSMVEDDGALEAKIAKLQKDLKTKKSFPAACRALAELAEGRPAAAGDGDAGLSEQVCSAMGEAGKSAFLVLQTRFSTPKFWQAGLDLFLALEFHIPSLADSAAKWREAAMEEVDEESRERARQQSQLRKVREERMHNTGRFGDNVTPVTQAELLAASGLIALAPDDGRPPMSRDAQEELRVVKILKEELCVICQESMPVGSRAKAMPCGHKFHDDCLVSWVNKSNSCPTCRFDEAPSEKRHFDDIQRQVERGGGQGLYS
jgi:hypothetical protein